MTQSKSEVIICNWPKARRNECEQVTIGLDLLLIGWKSGANYFFRQSCSVVSAKRITFWQSSETTLDKFICVDNADIDECASSPCLNGGTCTDVINGFRCACAASLTGIRCELGLGKFSFLNSVYHQAFACTSTCDMFQPYQYNVDLLSFRVHFFFKIDFCFYKECFDLALLTAPECNNYTVNTEADRSVLFPRRPSTYKCDRGALVPGWYRFNGTAGSKMPSYCVPKSMCNTDATGWLNGVHPTLHEGVVSRTVCFHWSGNCCNWAVTIQLRNCGEFFVYNLTNPGRCHLRYCVTK